jgi:hypothetical protein
MQQKRTTVVIAVAAALIACGEPPTAPSSQTDIAPGSARQSSPCAQREGTGLVLESLTGVSLPLIGQVGNIDIDQAVITGLIIDEVVGGVVGLEVEGVLTLSGGVLGEDIVTEEFLTQVHVVSSGPGECDVLTLELGPIALDALGDAVFVEAPDVAINSRSVGAVGSLLCNLGSVLQGPVSGVTGAVRGLVNAINRLLV